MLQNQFSRHKPRYIVFFRYSKIDPHHQVITRTRNLLKNLAAKHCLATNLRYVLTSSVFSIMSEVMNSHRSRVRLTKPPYQVSRALFKHRIQWLVSSHLHRYYSNEVICAQNEEPFSQCTTVPAHHAASLSNANTLTPRTIVPIQRANLTPETQTPNTKEATSKTSSRIPRTRTPNLRRAGPIHSREPSPQVARLFQDAENLASRGSEGPIGPVPACKDAVVANTSSSKKPSDTPMASSKGVRGLRSKKVDVAKTTPKP
jgi:hypothetical protein